MGFWKYVLGTPRNYALTQKQPYDFLIKVIWLYTFFTIYSPPYLGIYKTVFSFLIC